MNELHDLELVAAMHGSRLRIDRMGYRRGERREQFAGAIDLNPLVPEIAIAALR